MRNILYESCPFIFDPMNPPTTILKVHAIAIIRDYFIMSNLVKYITSQEITIAFIDFTVENANTGRATPGNSHTVKKLTGFYGFSTGCGGPSDSVFVYCISVLDPVCLLLSGASRT